MPSASQSSKVPLTASDSNLSPWEGLLQTARFAALSKAHSTPDTCGHGWNVWFDSLHVQLTLSMNLIDDAALKDGDPRSARVGHAGVQILGLQLPVLNGHFT